MNKVQQVEDGTFRIRPFLSIPKCRLVETCSARGIPFVLDPSNTDLQYDRNRVRRAIQLIRDQNSLDLTRILDMVDFFQSVQTSFLF